MSITKRVCVCVRACVCVCVRVCVCSIRYPARNAHVPYCHLWPDTPYNIFPLYFINGTIFEINKLLNTKCVSLQLFPETIFILRRTERYMIKNVYWSYMESTLYSSPLLMKLGHSRQIFEK
jgi:hypothetical protein